MKSKSTPFSRQLGAGFFLSFILFFLSPVIHAEISHYDLKGIDDLIAPEYQYLSPIYGFTLLGTKTLENLRFYGNYFDIDYYT